MREAQQIPEPTFWKELTGFFNKAMGEGGGTVELLSENETSCRVRIVPYIEDKDEEDGQFEGTITYLGKFAGVDMVYAGGFIVEACGHTLFGICCSLGDNWDNPFPSLVRERTS